MILLPLRERERREGRERGIEREEGKKEIRLSKRFK